jgi:hypothetical protein
MFGPGGSENDDLLRLLENVPVLVQLMDSFHIPSLSHS